MGIGVLCVILDIVIFVELPTCFRHTNRRIHDDSIYHASIVLHGSKNLCHLSQGSIPEKVEKEIEGKWLTLGNLENSQ